MENIVVINLLPGGQENAKVPYIPNSVREIPEIAEILSKCRTADKGEESVLLSNAFRLFEEELREIRRNTKIKGKMRICLLLEGSVSEHKFVSKVKNSYEGQRVVIEEYFLE